MKSISLEDLETVLEDVLPGGFQIDTDDNGQIIIFTNLKEDEEGNLVTFDEEDVDNDGSEEDFESYDESYEGD